MGFTVVPLGFSHFAAVFGQCQVLACAAADVLGAVLCVKAEKIRFFHSSILPSAADISSLASPFPLFSLCLCLSSLQRGV